ncbi:hypothetical protein K493DRAFT_273919 [Basidiobolus meristosporus CBS 931.73]|uniref:GPI mannosyltransferase 1 n=1 Tax=Basidiobolus meristosporus CBS 931.73 TaxID=1314790 RepID=A0A1Y1Z9N2_9FUNG|nr:hypothetical protein K493DRAFT_273919 [Basidiobolus meristosporus CBS 931.73]|eukprot:ORY06824.1 hypothetical protein K493DRAFT_273919 [Basidiobolus meristosporus CBS 931.73]
MIHINFTKICGVAIVLRLVLLIYGEWQDANMTVKYTDIDYLVFTDASRFVTEGKSPYERATYRYTPLLAVMLMPNIYLHKAFGKCLFVLADIVVGILIAKILQRRGLNPTKINFYTSLWLLNPVVANISTRGNAESLIGALILGFLYCLLTKRLYLGSILFGLSVHFKMYPIIYALPGLMLLDDNFDTKKGKRRAVLKENQSWLGKAVDFVNKKRIIFGLLSGGVFLLLNGVMYYLYGFEFLYETYLYHVTRKDHRHNFSVWFYHIYLNFSSPESRFLGLATSIPQLGITFLLGLLFGKDIFFSCFAQTFAFVMYNRVCTSQYFMWYICLFPLILPSTTLNFRWKGVLMILAWVGSQGFWLNFGYQLEFLGQNVFYQLWVSGILFFMANTWILVEFVQNHCYEPVFNAGKVRRVWASTK